MSDIHIYILTACVESSSEHRRTLRNFRGFPPPPPKNAGIIPALFPEAFFAQNFQTIIHLSSNHSTLYSRDIEFAVK